MPRATITKLKKNIGSDVFSSDCEICLKNRIHFKFVEKGEDLHDLCKQFTSLPSTTKDKIRFIFITDFNDVVAYDTKVKDLIDIEFIDLHKSYAFFLPLAGIEKYELTDEHPADIKASYKMGQLCDLLRRHNDITTPERVHAFNVFLTRLLFCFYAEDTGIFEDNQVVHAIQNTTDKNGSDLGQFFSQLFTVLNLADRDVDRSALPSHFSDFPYVNGGLFANCEWVPEFTGKARRMIIEAGSLEWDQINPDIFGSMFQSVIDPEQRGKLGQHYTSVPNIMKVIQPLFLDDLEIALEKSKNNIKKLQALLLRLQRIRVFDPACGSGNFLIIAYRELRKLEMKIVRALDELGEQSVIFMSGIRLSQFYGIEIDYFAHEIALLSMWLTENQMNTAFEAEFGHSKPMLPLKESGKIVRGNSLMLNWENVCPKADVHGAFEVYICGNPPFLGKQNQSKEQRNLQANITKGINAGSDLDFVCCWILKAAQYNVTAVKSKSALVATNSIVQGEQVSILWGEMFCYGIKIDFLYEPFIWQNSAQNKAAVHCTIVGFSINENKSPRYIIGTSIDNKNQYRKVKNISPYLIEGTQTLIKKRNAPFGKNAKMVYGNKPTDDGNFILSTDEKAFLIEKEPQAAKYIKRFVGARELLNGLERWCLWIPKISKNELDEMPTVKARVDAIARFRCISSDLI